MDDNILEELNELINVLKKTISLNVKNKSKKNCAIYCKVSTIEQAYDINLEIETCRNHSYVLNYSPSSTEHYIDEGYTGKTTDRPAFDRMMCDIRKNRISAIIIYDLDRMSRNIVDSLNFLKFLESQQTELYIMNGNYSNI